MADSILNKNLQDFHAFICDILGKCKLEFLSRQWQSCLLGSAVIALSLNMVKNYMIRRRVHLKIAMKRAKFDEKKKKLRQQLGGSPLMTLEREMILAYDFGELVEKLRNGQLDPVTVLQAYQARALEATEATNCVVDLMLEALEEAIELRKIPVKH